MPAFTTDVLTLIQDLLAHLREEQTPLASAEDADYFRKLYASKKAPPKPPEPPVAAKPKPIEIPPALPKLEPAPPPKPEPPIATKPIETLPPVQPMPIREESPAEAFEQIRKILAKTAPELAILNEIPADGIAKKISTRWKTKNQTASLSLLSLHEPPQQRALLEQIAKALDVQFGPAKLVNAESIEKEKQWEAFLSVPELKLVIACDYTLWQLNHLMHFYKENPTQGTRTLGTVSLFLLPDLSLYLKDPLLKRSLWRALCQKLSS